MSIKKRMRILLLAIGCCIGFVAHASHGVHPPDSMDYLTDAGYRKPVDVNLRPRGVILEGFDPHETDTDELLNDSRASVKITSGADYLSTVVAGEPGIPGRDDLTALVRNQAIDVVDSSAVSFHHTSPEEGMTEQEKNALIAREQAEVQRLEGLVSKNSIRALRTATMNKAIRNFKAGNITKEQFVNEMGTIKDVLEMLEISELQQIKEAVITAELDDPFLQSNTVRFAKQKKDVLGIFRGRGRGSLWRFTTSRGSDTQKGLKLLFDFMMLSEGKQFSDADRNNAALEILQTAGIIKLPLRSGDTQDIQNLLDAIRAYIKQSPDITVPERLDTLGKLYSTGEMSTKAFDSDIALLRTMVKNKRIALSRQQEYQNLIDQAVAKAQSGRSMLKNSLAKAALKDSEAFKETDKNIADWLQDDTHQRAVDTGVELMALDGLEDTPALRNLLALVLQQGGLRERMTLEEVTQYVRKLSDEKSAQLFLKTSKDQDLLHKIVVFFARDLVIVMAPAKR